MFLGSRICHLPLSPQYPAGTGIQLVFNKYLLIKVSVVKLYVVIVYIVRTGKSVEGIWKGHLLYALSFPSKVLGAV